MERRFTTLRVLATFFKVLAWLSLVVALGSVFGLVWGVFGTLRGGGNIDLASLWKVVTPVVTLSLSFYYFIAFLLLGHLISLGIAIEENTRATNMYLRMEKISETSREEQPAS